MTSIIKHLRFLKNPQVAWRILKNMVQVQTFLHTKGEIGRYRLRNCQIALTFVCNHSCSFCSSNLFYDKTKKELSLDEWMRVTDELYNLGITHVDLTGGEPTIKGQAYLTKLISHITKRKDVIVSIATNGKIVTDESMKQFKAAGLNTILFNLQSLDESWHDNQVRDRGNFQRIMNLINEAQKIGLNVGINTCLGTYNVNQIKTLANWCEENDIILCINLAAPTGNLRGQKIRMTKFKKEYYDFLKSYNVVRSDTSFNFRGANLCPGGIEKIYITAYGDVTQCTFCQISFGNVRVQSLAEIYEKFCKFPLTIQQYICKHTFNEDFRENWIEPIINNPNPPIKLENHPNYQKYYR